MVEPKVLAIYKGVGTHDPAWNDFGVFEAWALENGYADNLSIDRIDNAGGYWPDNCRWRTTEQQARNKTNHRWVEVGGERLMLTEAVERFGLAVNTITKRLDSGWSDEDAVRKLPQSECRILWERYRTARH